MIYTRSVWETVTYQMAIRRIEYVNGKKVKDWFPSLSDEKDGSEDDLPTANEKSENAVGIIFGKSDYHKEWYAKKCKGKGVSVFLDTMNKNHRERHAKKKDEINLRRRELYKKKHV